MASKKNVAQVIVDVLASVGVRRVYGVAGDSLNGLTDAIFSHDARGARVSMKRVRSDRQDRNAASMNGSLGFVQLEMRAAGFDRGVDLVNPDFAKIAEASGVLGISQVRHSCCERSGGNAASAVPCAAFSPSTTVLLSDS